MAPLVAAVDGVSAAALYLRTKPPTITWWFGGADSGDLASAAHTLGIPHPTGYPLFVLLGHAATRLPLGAADPAGRINTLNALTAAAGLALVALAIVAVGRRLGGPAWAWAGAAVLAPLAIGASEVYWSQAIIAEVHALHGTLAAAIMWLWARPHTSPLLRGAAHGLALTNHLTSVVLLAAAVVAFVPPWKGKSAGITGRPLALFLVGVTLPLLLYALLPVRAAQQPAANWGNPSTPGRFLAHVSGRQYHALVDRPQPLRALHDAASLLRLAVGDPPPWVAPAAAVGLVQVWQRARRYALFTALVAAGVLVGTALYQAPDKAPYLLPGYLVLGVWGGVGVAALAGAAQRLVVEDGRRAVRWALPAGGAALVLVTAVWAARTGARVDLRGDDSAVVFARATLESLPPGATYYTARDDMTFALWYAQRSLGVRRDVRVVDVRNPGLTAPP